MIEFLLGLAVGILLTLYFTKQTFRAKVNESAKNIDKLLRNTIGKKS